jgi:hypothetical protein
MTGTCDNCKHFSDDLVRLSENEHCVYAPIARSIRGGGDGEPLTIVKKD